MSKSIPIIDQIRINNPCTADWDSMIGNDEVRFCEHCAKDVHNLSAMTRAEAERLVANSNGNLCIRYYQLPRQKIETKDNLHISYRITRRISRVAAGAITAALTLSGNVAAQQSARAAGITLGSKTASSSSDSLNTIDRGVGQLSGTVIDVNHAVIVGAKVLIKNSKAKKEFSAETDERGRFSFDHLEEGSYTIKTQSPGFRTEETKNVKIKAGAITELEVSLTVGAAGGMGVMAIEDPTLSPDTRPITGDLKRKPSKN